ncbi:WD40 containing snare-dependent exocytosis protein [Guyanagaster necrorhizus]|uniref:WD40 containing snare-dependent exocytosis protein n=1 Tax=Guyanagaster necrorhizus TaxID=856835 RepID=A0A9P7W4Z8_9AGAR|nr:WD40 containing snare-dependent exocytosis protein [Guyanagaster necrorhizus MCA 3950]KAG7452249.1 WD40 containing snare-dependent exocytosis protein [Guyanagaster necrorhizus MCA 3950]
MSKYFKRYNADFPDLSSDLREREDWKPAELRSFDFAIEISALAVDPLSGLLAAGTADGLLFIWGKPGVDIKLSIPERKGVKLVQFSVSTFQIVCLDTTNHLHIWDLSNYGYPKYVCSALFDQTNAMTLSPSHSHAFLVLQSGDIRTYDLTCHRKTSYMIPNLWKLYENKLASSGMVGVTNAGSSLAIDAVIHPRNLNLLFVAYAGGIVLSDLTQRNTLRVYDLVLSPGAPGGTGYGQDILTHRRPEVTCIAVHPAGHFFAVGYTDGVIAYWAMEDEDQPLMVRTFDSIDVNVVDGHRLEEHLANPQNQASQREPIFKLSWSSFSDSSDPRGGYTALTVLGGLCIGDPPGISVFWLPAFNPPDPPTPVTEGTLHPFYRSSMRDTVVPTRSYFYSSDGTVQDYLLIPRNSPHLSGVFDPTSILILSESTDDTRALEAYDFPPPSFAYQEEVSSSAPEDKNEDTLDELSATLKSLQTSSDPVRLRLPWSLCSGILHGRLNVVDRDAYQSLVTAVGPSVEGVLPLNGGFSWNDESNDMKSSKFQPNRILITCHQNLTVRFYDISVQLLVAARPHPVQYDFPTPLPHLTMDLSFLVLDPWVFKQISTTTTAPLSIQSVLFSSESLESAVVMSTGNVLVFRLKDEQDNLPPYRECEDRELTYLEHLGVSTGYKYAPYIILSPTKGPTTACAISDIGFLSVAYGDGSLYIIDLRGPRILFYRDPKSKARNKHSIGLHLSDHTSEPFVSLTWTISVLESDNHNGVRLIGVRKSGICEVYTISRVTSSWRCSGDFVKVDGASDPFPEGAFMVDAKTGVHRNATRRGLSDAFSAPSVQGHAYFITTGIKGAQCYIDIDGDRIGKVDWSSKSGIVREVEVIEKLGSCALVAFTDKQEALVYSIPHLEFINAFPLPLMFSSITVDETGDFIGWKRHSRSGLEQRAVYGTLFDMRRSIPLPDIDLTSTKVPVPAQPQPVSMGPTSFLGSWLTFGIQSITGDQADELLGGPNRPIPQAKNESSTGVSYGGISQGVSALVASASATQGSLYERLSSALNDRGQILGDLEDHFNSLEQSSRSMATQAKRLAAEQTAKQWFRF